MRDLIEVWIFLWRRADYGERDDCCRVPATDFHSQIDLLTGSRKKRGRSHSQTDLLKGSRKKRVGSHSQTDLLTGSHNNRVRSHSQIDYGLVISTAMTTWQ